MQHPKNIEEAEFKHHNHESDFQSTMLLNLAVSVLHQLEDVASPMRNSTPEEKEEEPSHFM